MIEFRAVGIRWMISFKCNILSQRMPGRLGILSLAIRGFVFDRLPNHTPFILVAINILVAVPVISIDPSNRSQKYILIQGTLQFVGVATPMRVVQLLPF